MGGEAEVCPIDAVAELVAAYGAHARPLREVVAALTERAWSLDELIRATAVPRRTVEELVAVLGADLRPGSALTLDASRRDAYRARFGYEQLRRAAPADPFASRLADAGDLVEAMRQLRAGAPPPRRALDHVAATPETAARRAFQLDAGYDLAGAHLLCVGDHDLTALAACLVEPALTATVVDVDERLLAYVDEAATARGLRVRCLLGDLRFGLPRAAVGCADLAFADPPYTPEGVRLFLARALAGLRDRDRGRVLLAYGFSDRTPALGLKVQQTFGELHLAVESALPHFNRYLGAQAVGSASDLYTVRPTARTWRALDAVARTAATIYTHGAQSSEGRASTADDTVTAAVRTTAAGPDDLVVTVVGPAGRPLGALWAGKLPPAAREGGLAVDATADPGAWLLRILLAANARRVAVAVRGAHPDLADARSQAALRNLVAAKWTLRYRRSTPDPGHALVEAVPVDPADLEPGPALVRRVLDRAHGKLGNVWAEGLAAVVGLTRERARARVTAFPLDTSAMELPRHQLTALLAAVSASARQDVHHG